MILLAPPSAAQDVPDPPLTNWSAPPFWTPPPPPVPEDAKGLQALDGNVLDLDQNVETLALPTGPLPFVAITPCRLLDTRGFGFAGLYGPPALISGNERVFPVVGQCGLPAGAAALSLNATVTATLGPGFVSLYPQGSPYPGTSNVNYSAGGLTVANAAVVPLGPGGFTVIAGVSGTDLIVDVNGYYVPQNVVNTLNGLVGNVTLTAGSNVTITPSGQTLTIASSGGSGDVLPAGTSGQTLRHTGSAWTANSFLFNNGSSIGIGTTAPTQQLTLTGNLALPQSNAGGTAGRLILGGVPFLSNPGTNNAFVGGYAGSFAPTGANNTAVGHGALMSLTAGGYNTAVGAGALGLNTTAHGNVAVGVEALSTQSFSNGGVGWDSQNTAVGYRALTKNQPTSNLNGRFNVALGAYALEKNTIGSLNTAIGLEALRNNTTAARNTAVGVDALYAQSFNNGNVDWNTNNTAVGFGALFANQPTTNANALYNAAFGAYALHANTTGAWNTGIGTYALADNTTGGNNTAVGMQALVRNTIGVNNVGVGLWALSTNKVASKNTAVGTETLASLGAATTAPTVAWDSENTAVGYRALYLTAPTSITNGRLNTAVGSSALAANSTGYENTSVGASGLAANTTGYWNTSVGALALAATTGSENTAVGRYALSANGGGTRNTSVGSEAMLLNQSGSYNTALGTGALYSLVSGNTNTAIGRAALEQAKGSGNVALGYQAGSGFDGSNQLFIANTSGTPLIWGDFASDRVGINQAAATNTLDVNGTVRVRMMAAGTTSICRDANNVLGTCPASDARLKRDVRDLGDDVNVLEALGRLRGVTFNWDTDQERAKTLGNRRELGVLAQEVEAVLPYVVDTDRDGWRSVDYAKLSAFLVEVAKAQGALIDEQKTRLEAQDAALAALRSEVRKLAARVGAREDARGR